MKHTQIIELLKGSHYAKASEKLYIYFPVVKKLVLNNGGSKEDAEDVYQEALIILLRKVQAADFVLTSSLNTYLYSICRFLWSDWLKKKNKGIEVELENYQPAFNESELETLSKTESQNKLAEKAFQQLGEKCRQLLLLFYFKKLAMKDIALQLKFSSEKVAKNQKYRCIEKAKEKLLILISSSHE